MLSTPRAAAPENLQHDGHDHRQQADDEHPAEQAQPVIQAIIEPIPSMMAFGRPSAHFVL